MKLPWKSARRPIPRVGSLGIWAKRLHQKFSPRRKKYIGGIAAIRSVLTGRTYGFSFLRKHKRLDLSVEALVLKPQWKYLFCDEDRRLRETTG